MKKKYLSALLALALALVAALCPARAGAYVSEKDKASGNAAAIQKCTDAYNAAAARGDTAGMAKAHADAEAIRNGSGYSGGSDGSGRSSSFSSSSNKSSTSSGSYTSNGNSSSTPVNTTAATTQLAQISAAWFVAKAAYDAAVASGNTTAAAAAQNTMTSLHNANTAIAAQVAGNGGSVSFDAKTGVTTITTSNGMTITNANGTSQNGSTTTMAYQITDSSGNSAPAVSTTQYSDAAVQAYLAAGGTVDGLIASYNQTAANVAKSNQYGDDSSVLDISEELTLVKYKYNLTEAQVNELRGALINAKNDFKAAYDAYKDATTDAERAEALAKMQQANADAEAARGKIGYSGNSSLATDGGFFDAEDALKNGSGISQNGTGLHTFSNAYAISATAGANGSITPSGTVYVSEGQDKTFSFTPAAGYLVKSVIVDGVSVGRPSSYTFYSVKAAHSIRAEFAHNYRLSLGGMVVTDPRGRSLDDRTIGSGYGVVVTATDAVAEYLENVKATLTYDFGEGTKTVTMVASGSDYVLPVNANSPTGLRCVYIPIDAPDGSYTLTVKLEGYFALEERTVSTSKSYTFTVKGTMYDDDFTGSARG